MNLDNKIAKLNQPMTNEQYEYFVTVVTDIAGAFNKLPDEEQQLYIDAQQSVIDARRAGERLSHLIFIS